MFFGLTGSQEDGISSVTAETTATANHAGGRLVRAVRPKQERECTFTAQIVSEDGGTDATQ